MSNKSKPMSQQKHDVRDFKTIIVNESKIIYIT
jgi:hypothetical protein